MIIKRVLPILSIAIILFTSCKKSSSEIDVSAQWKIDDAGNLIQGLADGQWGPKTFSSQELALFQSLDTADLSGTTKPDSITSTILFPNPFNISGGDHLDFGFSNGYKGRIILKYVIVDNHLNALQKGTIKVQGIDYPSSPLDPSSSSPILLTPNVSIGNYRLYYTLSAQSNEHFYKSWGNIERAQ